MVLQKNTWDTAKIDECKNPAMYVRREKDSYKMSRSRSEKYKHWTLDGVTDQPGVLPFMFIGLLVRLVAVPKVLRGAKTHARRADTPPPSLHLISTLTLRI